MDSMLSSRRLHPALLALALFLAGAFTLRAAETRIAVFSLEEVFKNYYKTKIAESYITAQGREYQQQLLSMKSELSKAEEEFRVLRDKSQNIAFDDVEREKNRQAAERLARDIQRKRSDIDTYSVEKNRLLEELAVSRRTAIFKDITEVVRKRAALEGYTIVLDSSARNAATDTPVLVYSEGATDITLPVLEELNRGNQLAAPPTLAEKPVPAAADADGEETTEAEPTAETPANGPDAGPKAD